MTEQCHHWVDGVRCNKQASVKVSIGGSTSSPEPWKTLVCQRHADTYRASETYKFAGVK